jgi:hypothetical protein
MIAQIAYTNSNCRDLWEMFIKQNRRHTQMPLYMVSDVQPENCGYEDVLIYQNSDPYYKVWSDAVQKFGGEYFIYLQEDFLLYADVNQQKIDEFVEFLKKHPEYSFVRLLKSGSLGSKKLADDLYEIEASNSNIFAMQATIWRSTDYQKLMNVTKESRWLETSNYRDKMIAMNMKGAYYYGGESRIGKMHYDSRVYPYIATALVRGNWDMSEYGMKLGNILAEHHIDLNRRGII